MSLTLCSFPFPFSRSTHSLSPTQYLAYLITNNTLSNDLFPRKTHFSSLQKSQHCSKTTGVFLDSINDFRKCPKRPKVSKTLTSAQKRLKTPHSRDIEAGTWINTQIESNKLPIKLLIILESPHTKLDEVRLQHNVSAIYSTESEPAKISTLEVHPGSSPGWVLHPINPTIELSNFLESLIPYLSIYSPSANIITSIKLDEATPGLLKLDKYICRTLKNRF